MLDAHVSEMLKDLIGFKELLNSELALGSFVPAELVGTHWIWWLGRTFPIATRYAQGLSTHDYMHTERRSLCVYWSISINCLVLRDHKRLLWLPRQSTHLCGFVETISGSMCIVYCHRHASQGYSMRLRRPLASRFFWALT